MADVTVGDGRLLHRHGVDEGRRADDHAAGVLGQVFGEAVQLGRHLDEVTPARRVHLVPELGQLEHLQLHLLGVVGVGPFGQFVQVLGGQAQGFAQVPDDALHLVGADHAGQGGPVPAPFTMDSHDEFLPDVAGKVQVYVRDRAQVVGQEPVQGQVVLQGVDVGQTDQVAHQHGHRRAPPPPWRAFFQRYLGVAQAHLDHDLPGHLDDLVVDQEESRQIVFPDQPELLLQPVFDFLVYAAVAALRGLTAQVFQVALGSGALGDRVVRELVGQVLSQVEGTALGDAEGVLDGLGAPGEQGGHLFRRFEIELIVGPALFVGLLQAEVVLDGDQGVL